MQTRISSSAEIISAQHDLQGPGASSQQRQAFHGATTGNQPDPYFRLPKNRPFDAGERVGSEIALACDMRVGERMAIGSIAPCRMSTWTHS